LKVSRSRRVIFGNETRDVSDVSTIGFVKVIADALGKVSFEILLAERASRLTLREVVDAPFSLSQCFTFTVVLERLL